MSIIHQVHIEGPQRLMLFVGIPYSATAPSPTVSQVQPIDEIIIRAAHRGDLAEGVPGVVCSSCEYMNVTVLLRDDDEIETHRKIHEAFTAKVRYEQR